MTRVGRMAVGAAATLGATALIGAVLVVEGRLAKKWVGTPTERAPNTAGWYGHSAAEPLHLAVVGDSSVAGVGVAYAHETMAAILAAGLAAVSRRPVRLSNHGVSGAQTRDLAPQVRRTLADPPDVCVIVVGANDVTHLVRPSVSARLLAQEVRRLLAAGVPVVVGTCPDLGTVRPLAPPLRQVAWLWSRVLARHQTISVVAAGGRTVSLGRFLGPSFAIDPIMWSPDRFHPSVDGYAVAASALLPTVAAAVAALPDSARTPSERPARLMSLRRAANEAVRRAGTEVSSTAATGMARLRRRRPPLRPPSEDPHDSAGSG